MKKVPEDWQDWDLSRRLLFWNSANVKPAAYRKLEKEMLLEVDERTIDAGSAAVLTNKLLQLCSGAVYDGERNAVEIHRCKIDVFLELVERLNGQPALVFYGYGWSSGLRASCTGSIIALRRRRRGGSISPTDRTCSPSW